MNVRRKIFVILRDLRDGTLLDFTLRVDIAAEDHHAEAASKLAEVTELFAARIAEPFGTTMEMMHCRVCEIPETQPEDL